MENLTIEIKDMEWTNGVGLNKIKNREIKM